MWNAKNILKIRDIYSFIKWAMYIGVGEDRGVGVRGGRG